MTLEKEKESFSGLMEIIMMDNGKIIKNMEKENMNKKIKTYMMVIGLKIRFKDLESLHGIMEILMKDNG